MSDILPLFSKAIEHLETELNSLRTGRATPALVEHLVVDAYGTKTPLRELASISTPEPQSLTIQPWDVHLLKDIERAIQESSLDIQPINDGRILRLVMPALTEERRNDLKKIVNQKGEEARIAIRSVREKEMKQIKKQETDGAISEDESKKLQKEFQNSVEAVIKTIDGIISAKEQEILRT